MSNMAYGKVGNCILVVHTDQSPAQEEWDRYLDFVDRQRGEGVTARILVVTEGGAPTAVQRRKLTDVIRRDPVPVPVAVLTHNSLARHVVTALSWFYTNIRAFQPDQLDEALRYLGIPSGHYEEIRSLTSSLRKRLGGASPAGPA